MFIEYGFIGLVWQLWCYTAVFCLIVFLMVKLFDLIYDTTINIKKIYNKELLRKHCYIIYFQARYEINEKRFFPKSLTGHQIIHRDSKIKNSDDIRSVKDSLSEWYIEDGDKPNIVLTGYNFITSQFFWKDEFDKLINQNK